MFYQQEPTQTISIKHHNTTHYYDKVTMDSRISPETDLSDYCTNTETQPNHYNTCYINATYYEKTYVDTMAFSDPYTTSENNNSSANKVFAAGGVISSNLTINGNLGSSMKIPLVIQH